MNKKFRNPAPDKLALAAKLLAHITGQKATDNIPETWKIPLISGLAWTNPGDLVINILDLQIDTTTLWKKLQSDVHPIGRLAAKLLEKITRDSWNFTGNPPQSWSQPLGETRFIPIEMVAAILNTTSDNIVKLFGRSRPGDPPASGPSISSGPSTELPKTDETKKRKVSFIPTHELKAFFDNASMELATTGTIDDQALKKVAQTLEIERYSGDDIIHRERRRYILKKLVEEGYAQTIKQGRILVYQYTGKPVTEIPTSPPVPPKTPELSTAPKIVHVPTPEELEQERILEAQLAEEQRIDEARRTAESEQYEKEIRELEESEKLEEQKEKAREVELIEAVKEPAKDVDDVEKPLIRLTHWNLKRKPKIMIIGGIQISRNIKGEEWLLEDDAAVKKGFAEAPFDTKVFPMEQGRAGQISKQANAFQPDLVIALTRFLDLTAKAAIRNIKNTIVVSVHLQKAISSIEMAYRELRARDEAPWFTSAYLSAHPSIRKKRS